MTNIQKTSEKAKYQVKNWSAYNRSLINRGSITIWLEESVIENWYFAEENEKQKGGQYVYSDICMECIAGIKNVFKLTYRQSEGFVGSLFKLLKIEKAVPSYTQISRRVSKLNIKIHIPKTLEKLYVVCDSTGLKVYGEGEWKVRQHGISKRRTWRKLHLCIDEKTGYIHAMELTENNVDDASQVKPMLEQMEEEEIEKFSGDGAYDKEKCWDILDKKEIEGIIPPQKNAIYWIDENGNLLNHQRNKILEKIDKNGKEKWKKESGYHRRSLAETGMFRFKKIFGNNLYSRKIETQKKEAQIKIKVLNKMTGLGMPISELKSNF